MAEAKTKKEEKPKAESKEGDEREKYEGFIVDLHGRDYVGVDGRIKAWRSDLKTAKKEGDVNFSEEFWERNGALLCTIRCSCPLHGYGEATAGAYGKSLVDKSNPYENAETSAWGRLLGFWGYGLLGGGIASAEEMKQVESKPRAKAEKKPSGERTPGGATLASYGYASGLMEDSGIIAKPSDDMDALEIETLKIKNRDAILSYLAEVQKIRFKERYEKPLSHLDQQEISLVIDDLKAKIEMAKAGKEIADEKLPDDNWEDSPF